MSDAKHILEIEGLTKAFGGLVAVFNLDFTVRRGIIKAVIGPNGAGKTTLFNLISGLYPADRGTVRLNGQNVLGLKPYQIAAARLSRTFQTVELFKELTVLENVMLARHVRTKANLFSCGFHLPSQIKEEKEIKAKAISFLELVGLAEKASEEAGALPLGEQKILEIARALATDPEIILLDEPAAGLNETETERASQLLKIIKGLGVTILIVEHDMNLVMNISDEVMVLNYGQKIADDCPSVVRCNADVINAYLGVDIDNA